MPRQSEYDPAVHLSVTDVTVDNTEMPTMVYVQIKESKTDPSRKGAIICLAKTDNELCPVLALLPYLALRGARPGSLSIMQDHTFLTRAKFTDRLREILKAAGIDDPKYASHSFRSGAAAEASIPDVHIKMLGRWASEACQVYVKSAPENLAKVSKQLSASVKKHSSRSSKDN